MKWKNNYKKVGLILLAVIAAVGIFMAVYFNNKQSAFTIHIVHTNDIHAHAEENDYSGYIGFEKLSTIIQDYKENADLELVLDSGDMFQGQPVATLVYGESIAQLAKVCGYDAMTAGNHDWSYGSGKLKDLAAEANITMLAGNVLDEATGEKFFDEEFYLTSVEKDGVTLKIGIFGVIDPALYKATSPENVEGLVFADPFEYAQKAADDLKAQGCGLVIGLTHYIHPETLVSAVKGVDLWLTGHEHTSLNNKVTAADGSDTYMVQNESFLHQISLIELNCTADKKGTVKDAEVNISSLNYEQCLETEKDPAITKLLSRINEEVDVILSEQVGSCPQDLNGIWESLRTTETNLGVAVTDAYLLVSDADIAFENAGGIRASVNKGDITFRDILAVSPYGNHLIKKEITGAELKSILETSLELQVQCIAADESGIYDAWPNNSGSVLQCSGLTAEYDLTRPKGERILSLSVKDKEVDPDAVYSVVTNNFTAVDSTYPELAESEEAGQFCSCEEALIRYFSEDPEFIEQSIAQKHMIRIR